MTVAFEDVCAALKSDSFAPMVQDSIDILDKEILDTLENINITSEDDAEASEETFQTDKNESDDNILPVVPSTGKRDKIFRATDNFPCPEEIASNSDGQHQATYGNEDFEVLNRNEGAWRFSPTN